MIFALFIGTLGSRFKGPGMVTTGLKMLQRAGSTQTGRICGHHDFIDDIADFTIHHHGVDTVV